ncbi:TPA: hypothetical protein ACYZXY_001801 [Escherichia coli]
MDQPIILRENRSTTTARYSQPSWVLMQSVRVILEQMEGHEYAAISTYMNNMEAIACFYEEAGESLSEPDFLNYLKQNDLNLFIEILSVGRAISLMKNLLVNIRRLVVAQ